MLPIAWSIWKERNNRTFQRTAVGLQAIYQAVVREAEDWVDAGFSTPEVLSHIWSRNSTPM
jgi:hypothetical protein